MKLVPPPHDRCPFTAVLTWTECEPGLRVGHLTLDAAVPAQAPELVLEEQVSADDVRATWTAMHGMDKGLRWDWGQPFVCGPASGTPVVCLHAASGRNVYTFAVSPADATVELNAGVHEEDATFHCRIRLRAGGEPAARHQWWIRVDQRPLLWHQALGGVSQWWESLPGGDSMPVPDAAFEPMYSTWYAYHQQLDAETLLRQCTLAADLGCRALIVDDGWQTLDNARGYAWCGDWRPDRLPDMRAFVDRVHALGMKVLLWYSVPYVGDHSEARRRFEGKFLAYDARKGAHTLDPRFPDVRAHLVDLYRRALLDWDLDGFKLDFIDAFPLTPSLPETRPGEMDHRSVGAAVRTLLHEVRNALSALRPDVLIEFRQSYVGPVMRACGNLFRAGDCPRDSRRNRISVTDLRVMSGSTAVHADMILWHPGESAASAALQFINVLFAVLQYSMRIDELSAEHLAVSRFWIGFMREHRDVLLHGTFAPHHPEAGYPWIESWTKEKHVAVVHDNVVLPLKALRPETWVVNGQGIEGVVVELPVGVRCEIRDATGSVLGAADFSAGLVRLPIPPSGLAKLQG